MKEFNLEAAKAGEPIRTRDGDSLTFIGTDVINGNVIVKDECDDFLVYPVSGNCPYDCVGECMSDIVMANKKKIQHFIEPVEGRWLDTLWTNLEAARASYPNDKYREVEI